MGGMGFVHYNNTIEEQAQHVLRVKRHRPGFDIKPIVMPPTATIMQMDLLRGGSPVVDQRGPPQSAHSQLKRPQKRYFSTL
eukprot:scaffold170585_cov20-Tisochrysis_lutea.AAC.2